MSSKTTETKAGEVCVSREFVMEGSKEVGVEIPQEETSMTMTERSITLDQK